VSRPGITDKNQPHTRSAFSFHHWAVVVALLWAMLLPSLAQAQQLKCDSQTMSIFDEGRLMASARAALPSSVKPHVASRCRAEHWAHGWIETAHTITEEGVRQWWELACQRSDRAWTCDEPHFKQLYDMQLRLGDQQRAVEFTFDKNTSLSEALSQASQALTLYVDPAARLAECTSGSVEEAAWAKIREDYRLPEKARPLQVTVTRNSGLSSVRLDDIQIEIRFPFEVGAPTEFEEATLKAWMSVALTRAEDRALFGLDAQ
jgi:hypothetical protein